MSRLKLVAAKALHTLVRLKFSDVPEWVEHKIYQADKTHLERWIERILTAESIDHLFVEGKA